MNRQSLRLHRLLALFALGCLLFNYPLLALFNLSHLWGGIPPLFAYIFGAWAGIIAVAAWIVEFGASRHSRREN